MNARTLRTLGYVVAGGAAGWGLSRTDEDLGAPALLVLAGALLARWAGSSLQLPESIEAPSGYDVVEGVFRVVEPVEPAQ